MPDETTEFDEFTRRYEQEKKATWEPEHRKVVEAGGFAVRFPEGWLWSINLIEVAHQLLHPTVQRVF